MDRIEKYTHLSTRINKLRMRAISDGNALLNAYNLDIHNDLRITSISRLSRLFVSLDVSFAYLVLPDDNLIADKIRLPHEKDIEIQQYLLWHEMFLKLGSTSSLFFIVEGVIKNYLEFLNKEEFSKINGILNICDYLLTKEIEWDIGSYNSNNFNFLRLLRNTLHSNGIHFAQNKRDKNICIMYKGNSYQFSEGERVDFASWDLIIDLADDMRDLLFHLANNKTTRKVKGIIPDKYALK